MQKRFNLTLNLTPEQAWAVFWSTRLLPKESRIALMKFATETEDPKYAYLAVRRPWPKDLPKSLWLKFCLKLIKAERGLIEVLRSSPPAHFYPQLIAALEKHPQEAERAIPYVSAEPDRKRLVIAALNRNTPRCREKIAVRLLKGEELFRGMREMLVQIVLDERSARAARELVASTNSFITPEERREFRNALLADSKVCRAHCTDIIIRHLTGGFFVTPPLGPEDYRAFMPSTIRFILEKRDVPRAEVLLGPKAKALVSDEERKQLEALVSTKAAA